MVKAILENNKADRTREWGITPDEVNHSQAGNVFMLGAGGVVGESPQNGVYSNVDN